MDIPTAVQNFVTQLCECNGKETVARIRDEYHRNVVKGVNPGTPENAPKNPPVPGTGQIYASFIRTNTGVPFIASQAPTKHVLADYLSMLWENDVKLVVQLCKVRTNTGVPFIASQAPTKHVLADYLSMLWENDVKLVVQLCKVRTNTGVPFIASQAPTKHVLADYLSMLWENDVKLVMQLCKEDGRAKSYLSATSGHFKVQAEQQSDGPDGLQRRTLKLTKEKCGTREIEHLLYSDWRDHCVPSSMEAFREIWRRVESFHAAGQTVLVHCLGGRGRTGAFLSALTAYLQLCGNVDMDVIQVVRRVRAQRMYSVETSLQYLFVYRLVLELCLMNYNVPPTPQLDAFLTEYYAAAERGGD